MSTLTDSHLCTLTSEEKDNVIRNLKTILKSFGKRFDVDYSNTPSVKNAPMYLKRRFPRFQANWDLTPLITPSPVLELRPTSNPKLLKTESENPNVVYIKIDVPGNPFKTEWDEIRNIQGQICPKHRVGYKAHVHHKGHDQPESPEKSDKPDKCERTEQDCYCTPRIPQSLPHKNELMDMYACKKCGKLDFPRPKAMMEMFHIPKEQAKQLLCNCKKDAGDSAAKGKAMSKDHCPLCGKVRMTAQQIQNELGQLKYETICLCKIIDKYLQDELGVPLATLKAKSRPFIPKAKVENVPVKAGVGIEHAKKQLGKIKEICFCKPRQGDHVTYLCDCEPPRR